MTKDTREYLTRYRDVLQAEHNAKSRQFFEHMLGVALSLGMVVFVWHDKVWASVFAAIFGYSMAVAAKIHGKLREVFDELKGIQEQLYD